MRVATVSPPVGRCDFETEETHKYDIQKQMSCSNKETYEMKDDLL